MRYLAGLVLALALGVMGCSETSGGADGGASSLCEDLVCVCTEAGIRAAIAEGGGPYTFDCDDPTTLVTEAEIVVDNDVILDGESKLTLDGSAGHRVLFVAEGATADVLGFSITGSAVEGVANAGALWLADCAVSGNNRGGSNGGGVWNFFGANLTLINSTVSGNTASRGAGIYNSGSATLVSSTVSGNTAESPVDVGLGGGIYGGGALTLVGSTVSGNTADEGGGIFSTETANLTLTNSTVSGNRANNFGGGGIYNQGGTVTLANSTVSGNTGTNGGAIYNQGGGRGSTITLYNSLIDGDCLNEGVFASGGYNIESPGNTCGFDQPTDQVDVSADDLKLGPLQDNGGPTMTHALGEGSVAIDQIPVVDNCERLETDQRGVLRPQGEACDVGAVEHDDWVIDCTGTPDETGCWANVSATGICIEELCHMGDCETFVAELGDPCYIYVIGHGYDDPDPGFCAFSSEYGFVSCALSCFELEEGAPCREAGGSELGVCEAGECVFE